MHRTDSPHAGTASITLLESFDSWAQLLRYGPPSTDAGRTEPAPTLPEAEPYRPTLRRPLALLHVVDDGRDDGETIRLRGDRLVIGRAAGDVRVEHDVCMASPHAALERTADGLWRLADLGSDRGTFVRVLAARLHPGSCVQLGATRFRFELPSDVEPRLVELAPDGDGPAHACRTPLTTIGRRGGGADVLVEDRFVSPLHAELRRTENGWRIANRGLNGLWVRIDGPVRLACPSQFQCGEQRFVFVPLAE
ncbi:MAG: FHA domain-containing protein [Planctomycetia bacterium]|nr:FHA domain-containing protein [Planctomycetia bacterium]